MSLKDNEYGLRWNRDIDPEKAETLCAEKFPVLTEVKELELTKGDTGSDQNNVFGSEVESPTHLIIEGDNLHSLAVLCYTHVGKIKVIYIDPPYNTGNKDFRYNDSWVERDDPNGKSLWLSFIKKRLMLAKILLADDGFIFISIDDNMLFDLKIVCDDIFGSDCFLNNITWVYENSTMKNSSKRLATKKESILFYTKNVKSNYELNPLREDNVSENLIKRFGKYTDSNGDIRLKDVGHELSYLKRIVPKFRKKYGRDPQDDDIIDTLKGNYVRDVWNIPATRTNELKNLLDIDFKYPKPLQLIKRIIKLVSGPDSIVLDFFAGSGTTGHAVLDVNKEDGGNRQFILCTNDENNICTEVCYPRIKRVMCGYKSSVGKETKPLGGTLKYFKTDFVDRTENIAHSIAATCSGVLRIKEDSYNELENNEDYEIYYQDNDSLLAIYKKDWNFNPEEESLLELRDILNGIEECENKTLYVFSTDDQVDVKEEFADWVGVDVKLMPFDIIDVYKRVFDYELKKGR